MDRRRKVRASPRNVIDRESTQVPRISGVLQLHRLQNGLKARKLKMTLTAIRQTATMARKVNGGPGDGTVLAPPENQDGNRARVKTKTRKVEIGGTGRAMGARRLEIAGGVEIGSPENVQPRIGS